MQNRWRGEMRGCEDVMMRRCEEEGRQQKRTEIKRRKKRTEQKRTEKKRRKKKEGARAELTT
jgi:hypothetical protein